MPANAPDTGSTFMQRLGYYALGISLGLLILGWFQVQKMRTKQVNPDTNAGQVERGTGVDAPDARVPVERAEP